MPFHDTLPPPAWHGAKVDSGTLAARPIPTVVGQLYFVTSGASAGKVFIAEDTTSQADWKEIADINTPTSSSALEVRDTSNNVNVNPTTRLIFPDNTVSETATGEVTVDIPDKLEVGDFDYTMFYTSGANRLLFTDHSLVYRSTNEYHIDSPLQVVDPTNGTFNNVRVIQFPDGSVTSPNPHEIVVDVSASSSGPTSNIHYIETLTRITDIWQTLPSQGKYTEDFFIYSNIRRNYWPFNINSYAIQFNNGLQPAGVFLVTCNIYTTWTSQVIPLDFRNFRYQIFAETYDNISVVQSIMLESSPFAGHVIDDTLNTIVGRATIMPTLMFSHSFYVDDNVNEDFRFRFFINGDETILDDWQANHGLEIYAYVSITQVR